MRKKPLLIMVVVVAGSVILLNAILSSAPRMHDDYAKFSYKFVRLYKHVNLTGPTVNPIRERINWRYDLSHRVICNASDPFIINLVPSAIPHFEQRRFIRRTWADPALYPFTRMRTVFVLGKTLNATLQELVDVEVRTFDDIIQHDFIDTYRNLTYKSIAWLSWVQDWCPEAPWVVKIDDDVMVNPFHLRTYLAEMLEKDPSPIEIIGRMRDRNKPMRAGKWNVTKEEYDLQYYPPFLLGPAYIVSANAIDRLLEYVSYTPLLWLEDVYITGLVASAAGVKRVQAEKILYTKKLSRKLYTQKETFLLGANDKRKKSAWTGIVRHSPARDLYRKTG